ncbi:hypothetical protein NQ318_012961 [Aromia moschata]|uniref:C-type lectin domain-containing protein n=1 Tax=Aromia moschata TaxID=1265417 RepID=A0AAV8XPP7_9CUCU|nr:hypothetical protein NQ318_012961 [Aromia moschata]
MKQKKPENGSVVDITPSLHLQKFGNTYYYFGTTFKGNYFQALQFCNLHGMSLLSVESEEEIGGTDRRFWTSGTIFPDDTHWVWLTTGKPITYTNWLPKQPDNTGRNEKCLELRYGSNLMWNDAPWNTANLVICEIDVTKENSNILTGVTNCNLTVINIPSE